jgi:hypothetical protein
MSCGDKMNFFWILVSCTGKVSDTGSLDLNIPPTFQYEQPTERIVDGAELPLSVTVIDEDGIQEVSVYYRSTNSAYWDSMQLISQGDVWTGVLEEVNTPGVEFYFKAVDLGTPEAYAFYPEEGPNSPVSIEVSPVSRTLPFVESFELTEEQFYIRDLDWWTPSDGRNTFSFSLSSSNSNTGQYSAVHHRGSEGVDRLGDWLISPPLDFSSEEGVMVSWWEYGLNVDDLDSHSLWISTGERLPEENDFVEVVSLDAPISGEWSRHPYIDLSAWAGEPLVYLAWRWEGSYADEWYIDDIRVQSLGPDFLSELSWSPTISSPGDLLDVTVSLENQTSANAEDVEVSLVFPSGGVNTLEQSLNVDLIEGEASEEITFQVTLDSSLAENRRLPVEVTAIMGEEEWRFEHELLVGLPSYASMEVQTFESTQIVANVGIGDPDNPNWIGPIYAGILDAGIHTLELDITDQYELLPPTEAQRWFIQFETNANTNVTSASINYGVDEHSARMPQYVQPDIPVTFVIPHPPEFYLIDTTPASTEPGAANVAISLNVNNYGSPTQGPVTASIQSLDSTVIVNGGSSLMIDSDIWESGESNIISGATVTVDSSHTTSLPIHLIAILTDGFDVWEIPFEVEVPWPSLSIVSVAILDDDANDNGILESSETADIEITIVNSGSMNASGLVSASLSVESTSTASATVNNDNPSFGFMNVGTVEDEDDFTVTVTSGSVGDYLNFTLDMTDNLTSYSDSFQLVLGEVPWLSLTPLNDDINDSLDTSSPDLLSAEYRVINDIAYLRIESNSVINPTSAFFEIWGESGGSAYSYYRWVVQSGVASIQGYNGGAGFQSIGTMNLDFPDDYHIVLSWDTTDMDLALNTISIGIAAGWCGPPEYYCDHYPNYWGYPYVSFSPSSWFTMSW